MSGGKTGMKPPLGPIGVILPYFNRQDTLQAAIASVLGQSWRNLVLYLVNDCSTDASEAVARSFDDPRIEHLSTGANSGVSAARNVGLARTGERFVAFMDSDDVWLAHKLERQIDSLCQYADRGSVGVVGCGWVPMSGSSRATRDFHPGPFGRRDVLGNSVAGIGTPMLLIDRSVASPARFDEDLPALVDRDYVMSATANGSLIIVVTEPLVLVRRGRADHVASAGRAALAYEYLCRKYAPELTTELSSRYAFMACREHIRGRSYRSAAKQVKEALRRHTLRRGFHLGMGLILGDRGFAVAKLIGGAA